MKVRARGVVAGRASGRATVVPAPFSFVGGVDVRSGRLLDPVTGTEGEHLAGRIFAFPTAKGSTVGSYVMYALAKAGEGPAGIVNRQADPIVAVGATLSNIPLVDGVDAGGLRTGDRMAIDGDRGVVELPDLRAKPVVSAILRNRGRILLVRRSEAVGSFRGKWSAVSGYLEGREEPRRRAALEVREETRMKGITLRRSGLPILAREDTTIYVVHPFLFDVPTRRLRLDWENVEYRWIRPEDLGRFDTVPRLRDVVAAVLALSSEQAGD